MYIYFYESSTFHCFMQVVAIINSCCCYVSHMSLNVVGRPMIHAFYCYN